MMSSLFKTRASSLAKVANLPRYRHPADLINEDYRPIYQQNKQINGELEFNKNLYPSQTYQKLVKTVTQARKAYRATINMANRKKIATTQINAWNSYFDIKYAQLPQTDKIDETLKQRIYQAMVISKQRSEERLALNRFILFFNQYSKGWQFSLQIHPLVLMRLVHPHFGYFNNFPTVSHYKVTLQNLFTLLQQFTLISNERKAGNSLHFQQLMSLMFWRIFNWKNKHKTQSTKAQLNAMMPKSDFVEMLKYFKFENISKQNFQKQFSFSIKKGQIIGSDSMIRFDLWRQIYLDRNL